MFDLGLYTYVEDFRNIIHYEGLGRMMPNVMSPQKLPALNLIP